MMAGRLSLLVLAAFVSGASALLYEILWIRRLGETFGSTAHAIAVVLSVFFLGLGVGAYAGGRIADRMRGSVLLYVGLEIVTAAYGLVFLALSGVFERWYGSLAPAEWAPGPALLFKAMGAFLLLLLPTTAIGGTLPALARHAVRRSSDLAPRLGWLYGVNTIGAAAGCAIVVLVLIPKLGVPDSFVIAAAANVLAALLALAGRLPAGERTTAPRTERGSVTGPVRSRGNDRPAARVLLLTAALSGFVAVSYEVLWTRALASRFLGTVYSFATILVAYLLCLGLGSLLVGWLQRAGHLTRAACATIVTGGGLAGLLSVVLLSALPTGLPHGADPTRGLADRQLLELSWSVGVMVVPLLLFGLSFPLLTGLAHRELGRVGREVGAIYLANTIGSVTAPLVVGLWLLPLIGIRTALIATAWLLVLFGALALAPWSARGRSRGREGEVTGRASRLLPVVAIAAALALTFFSPRDVRLWRFTAADRLIAYREGVAASISVAEEPDGNRFLKIDNNYRLGDARTRFAQQRQGLIPAFLHRDPRRVLFIGMGTGSSAGVVAAWEGIAVDVLEIIPELRALLPLFTDINAGLADRARSDSTVRLLAADARHFVRTTPRRYDVVVGDLFVPWRSGEGAMFTLEHFEAVRRVLDPGGVFCQWLPLYQLEREDLRTIVATFCQVFPESAAYWLYFNAAEPAIGLVGSDRPLVTPMVDIRKRLEGKISRAEILTAAGLNDARWLLGSWIAGGETLREWSAGAPIETRDHPRIEFRAPRGRFGDDLSRSAANVEAMLGIQRGIDDSGPFELPFAALHDAKRYQRGVANYFRGRLATVRGNDARTAIAAHAAAFLDVSESTLFQDALLQNVEAAMAMGLHDIAAPGIAALQRAPRTEHVGHYLAARVALAHGDTTSAKLSLGRALKVNPEHEESWELLREIEAGPSP